MSKTPIIDGKWNFVSKDKTVKSTKNDKDQQACTDEETKLATIKEETTTQGEHQDSVHQECVLHDSLHQEGKEDCDGIASVVPKLIEDVTERVDPDFHLDKEV